MQSLGYLYINTKVELAPKAEILFLDAINIINSTGQQNKISPIYKGLIYTFFSQAKFEQALDICNKYLTINPDDKKIDDLKEIINNKIFSKKKQNLLEELDKEENLISEKPIVQEEPIKTKKMPAKSTESNSDSVKFDENTGMYKLED